MGVKHDNSTNMHWSGMICGACSGFLSSLQNKLREMLQIDMWIFWYLQPIYLIRTHPYASKLCQTFSLTQDVRTLFKILANALLIKKLITSQAHSTLAQYKTLLVTSITNILAISIQLFNSKFFSLFHFVVPYDEAYPKNMHT